MRFADDLVLFAHLVDNGSYSDAARALGVQKSFLSRRIAALEAALGLDLLERSARGLHITDLGMRVYAQACQVRTSQDEAFRIVDEHLQIPSGSLRIICPTLLSETLFGEVAVSFAANNPAVKLTFDVRTVVASGGLQNYDIVILPATGPLPDVDFVARRMMIADYRLVAAPSCELAEDANCIEALQGCAAIGWWHDGAPETWKLEDQDGNTHDLAVKPTLRTNDLRMAAKAAIAGLGIARLPIRLAAPYLADGSLVEVLCGYRPMPVSIYAAYSSRRALTAAGRAFLAELEDAAARS